MKFIDAREVFSELPSEISLAISISNCPIHCVGCHSKYLWEDTGKELNTITLQELLNEHKGISCFLFMGGDRDIPYLNSLASWIKCNTKLKTAVYSGFDVIKHDIKCFDYIKIGHYDSRKGPLNSKQTNQILYKVNNGKLINITKLLQHETDD